MEIPTNKNLIEYIKSRNILKDENVEKALKAVPRENFVPAKLRSIAYRDTPLYIGEGQTISQPSTVVLMTQALDVRPKQKILEIGAGSGWQAAILSKFVEKYGKIYTVERIHKLFLFAKSNIRKMKIKNIEFLEGDGSEGLEKFAPYDRIIVTAACPEIPQPLIEQLKLNGKLVIPIGSTFYQEVFIVQKKKDGMEMENIGMFSFVPLIGKYGFK